MDYCNGVRGFINFTTSISINFTRGNIRCPYWKCQNKTYMHQDVVMMHLLHKRVCGGLPMLICTRRTICL